MGCRGPFGQTRRNFAALNGPKYKPRGLQRVLDQYFDSDPLLDRALTSIIIPAFDTKIQQPVFFSSWRVSILPLILLQPISCKCTLCSLVRVIVAQGPECETVCEQAQRDPLENPPIKAVCRATSAAPTYLPPIHFTLTDTSVVPNETREFNLIDGGVVVNNPVSLVLVFLVSWFEAVVYWLLSTIFHTLNTLRLCCSETLFAYLFRVLSFGC